MIVRNLVDSSSDSFEITCVACAQNVDVKICQNRTRRPSCSPSILSQGDIEAVQKSVNNAISMAAEKSQHPREYNWYSKEQRAMIGKYPVKLYVRSITKIIKCVYLVMY